MGDCTKMVLAYRQKTKKLESDRGDASPAATGRDHVSGWQRTTASTAATMNTSGGSFSGVEQSAALDKEKPRAGSGVTLG